MAPLLLELSSLEVEPLDVVTRTTQQEESLDTLTTVQRDVVAVLTSNGILPLSSGDTCGGCGFCCCCPCCCCWR